MYCYLLSCLCFFYGTSSLCTIFIVVVCFCFFFFKQKTAYEMRISDWSSTCALPIFDPRRLRGPRGLAKACRRRGCGGPVAPSRPSEPPPRARLRPTRSLPTARVRRPAGSTGGRHCSCDYADPACNSHLNCEFLGI